MKINFANHKLALIAAGIISAAHLAPAAQVTYTYTGETAGGVNLGISTASYTGNINAGQFILTTTTAGYPSPLLTYCTDIGVFLASPYNYTPTALSAATGVTPAWISGGIQNAATLWYNDKGAATTAIQTAGLQIAIWQLLYNSVGSSYTSSTFASTANGGFHITSSDANTLSAEGYAATVLNSFKGLPVANNVEWLAPTEANGTIGGSQGLLMVIPGTQNVPTPDATSTLGLFGMAIGMLGVIGKKFKKN